MLQVTTLTTPSSKDTGNPDSGVKTPRRVQVMTLESTPTSRKSESSTPAEVKARRVQVTTLSTPPKTPSTKSDSGKPSTPSTKVNPSEVKAVTPSTSGFKANTPSTKCNTPEQKTPRRVQVMTLSTPTSSNKEPQSTDKHTPRRVQVTTIETPSKSTEIRVGNSNKEDVLESFEQKVNVVRPWNLSFEPQLHKN